MKIRFAIGVLGVVTAATATPAQAIDYPQRPVKVIVSLPPGSGADTTARYISKVLSEKFNQPFIVENRTGGNSFIAAQAVAKAAPDGYTLFVASNSPMTTNAAVFKQLPYDPVNDFTPIAPIAKFPMVFVVPQNSPWQNMSDLVAAARNAPGKLNFGSGTATYQANIELFHEMNGIKGTNVPYKGTSAAMTDLAGSVIQYSLADVSATLPLIRGNRLRALAVATDNRIADLPDTPTVEESGTTGYRAFAWTALYGPAKMDPAVSEALSTAVQAALKTSDATSFLAGIGGEAFLGGGNVLRDFQKQEFAAMSRVVKNANMQIE